MEPWSPYNSHGGALEPTVLSIRSSGVARSLPFGGQSASVARKNGVRGKFLGATPFRHSENEGNALFSYILHHKNDYIERKMQDVLLNFDQEFILIIANYSKKANEEFLFSYKRSNISSTKCEMDLLSFTAK